MPTDVFRAVDAVLVLSVEDKSLPEGAAADALVAQYDLSNTVGRLRNLTISVLTDLRPFYGTIERAHINGALLRLLLGGGATSPPGAANFVQPAFNIIASLRDTARPDQFARVIVFGARFSTWTYTIPADDFVMESVGFQALRVAFEES
jgi:hypothetical protein